MRIFTEKKYKEKRKFIIKLLIASLLLIGGSVIRRHTSMNTPISTPICPSPRCDKE